MAFVRPNISDFKTFFPREFPYQPVPFPDPPNAAEPDKYVQDSDIQKAMDEAGINFNPSLFKSDADAVIGFLYLTAHYLHQDLAAAAADGYFNWPETSKSVGSVSQSFQIPQKILDNPMYLFYSKTYYGMKYLMLIYPRLIGNIFAVTGRTLP